MAIEEPSVVAGVSGAAKTISAYDGFKAVSSERNTIVAQVCLLDIPQENMEFAVDKVSTLINSYINLIISDVT